MSSVVGVDQSRGGERAGVIEAPSREAFASANDWLNATVKWRLSQMRANGEPLTPVFVWVARSGRQVYPARSAAVLVALLAMMLVGIAGAPSAWGLFFAAVALYFYVDFYSGVMHVVLDHPRFLKWRPLAVPCAEFQMHHVLPHDIATRPLVHVWGDLNGLLLAKGTLTLVLAGVSPVSRMVIGVGFFWAYVHQFAHRSAHRPRSKLAASTRWLQRSGLLLASAVHREHHTHFDRAFPGLSGFSRKPLQWMLRAVPDRRVWLLLFLLLSVMDLAALCRLILWAGSV